MLRDNLKTIATTYYSTARRRPRTNDAKSLPAGNYAKHPLAALIRGEAVDSILNVIGRQDSTITAKGSPGQDDWAHVPWLAIYDPLASSGATNGYYVVYLFDAEAQRVHLSLNQGTYSVEREFNSRATQILAERAALMQEKISDALGPFTTQPITFQYQSTLTKNYAAGHIAGRTYDGHALPDEAELQGDLGDLMRLYRTLIFRGGLDFEDQIDDLKEGAKSITETRSYKFHKRIERNPKASSEAKSFHGYVCKCCGFDFQAKYGERGKDYIEAHHLRPLSSLEEGVPVEYDIENDFTVLCSNCHRMVHRNKELITIEELKKSMKKSR
ncbi:MrcB family domain-containing protein [Agrobacterium sp. NPDC058088]|uniref:MrcB family domain-containing protein n=1 Tax=Agrobacterium sp. NPDC058088 TaxID=3346335 RepID=UPI0036D8E72C